MSCFVFFSIFISNPCTSSSSPSNKLPLSCSPAVTSYPGQASFPSLAQSTVYSSFPQTGQTYGLPPFGQSSLLCRSINPVRSLSASRHQHHRNFCFNGPHCAWEPLARFSCDRWRAASSVNSASADTPLLLPLLFFFSSSYASLCSLFFIHFFHLQVLCGQALKLRLGCLMRPLVVSQGFSASALHTLRASKAIFTTHIPTKASCDLTLPHRITPPSFPSSPHVKSILFHSFVIFGKHFSSFFFPFLAAASTVFAEHLHVSRLELYHVQRVFEHPFGYSHHHSSLQCDSTGESCLSQE